VRKRAWPATALVLFAVMVAGLPTASAAAAATPPVINTSTTMSGAPSHVAAKGTLTFTVTFVNKSKYQVYLSGLTFEVWNRCLCPPEDSDGTKATYRDPSTGTWRTTPGASGDAYALDVQDRMLTSPGQRVTIPVRLNVGHFRSGSYILNDNGTTIGNVLDSHGNDVAKFDWRPYEGPYHYFTIGSAKPPAPAATGHSPATGHATGTTTRPAATPSTKPKPKPKPTSTSRPASPSSSPTASATTGPAQPVSLAAGAGGPHQPTAAASMPTAVWLLLLVPPTALWFLWRRRRAGGENAEETAGLAQVDGL
jgi:hypothetical protein